MSCDDANGARLAATPQPQGRYATVVVHGDIAYSAGMTPRRPDGELIERGIVGVDVSQEAATSLAGVAATRALQAVSATVGGITAVERCLRLTVYVAAEPRFTAHTAVADGAVAALSEHLGERAVSARSAIGVASLPSGAPVEVELTVALVRER